MRDVLMPTVEEIYAVFCIGYILYLSIVSASILLGIYLIMRAYKAEEEIGKINLYKLSAGLFFIVEAASTVIRWYFMFIYPPNLLTFYDIVTSPIRYDPMLISLVYINVGLVFYGCSFLSFGVEREIFTKTKYLFTILIIISSSFILILPYQIVTTIQIIPIGIIFIIIFALVIIYFSNAIQSSGNDRKNFLKIGFGFCLFFAGIIINSLMFRVLLHLTGSIFTITISSPLFIMSGLILLFLGFKT